MTIAGPAAQVRPEGAASDLDALPPDARVSAEALRRSGLAALRRRRFPEAAREFAAWTDLDPQSATAWLSLARSHALTRRIAEALRCCERALALDPELLRGHLLQARLAGRTKNAGLRIAALQNAIQLRPNALAMRVTLAGLMLRRTKFKAALGIARDALSVSPSNLSVLAITVRCHVALGQLAQATAMLKRLQDGGADAADLARLREELADRKTRMAEAASSAGTAEATRPAAPVTPLPLSKSIAAPAAKPRPPAAAARKALPAAADTPRDEPPPLAYLPERTAEPRDRDNDVEGRIDAATLMAIERRRPRTSLIDHILILRSLILRDLRVRHHDSSLGVLVELIRPSVVVFVHYWLFYFLRKPMPAQIPIEAYVLSGFSVWFAFSATWSGAAKGSKWPGGATSFPGVTDLHLRVARAGWDLMVNLTFCLLALVPLNIYGGRLPLPDVPTTFLIFGIAGGLGFGVGLTLDGIGSVVPLVKTAEKILTWALFVTSGLYFSLGTIPPIVADYFWYSPLIHLIEYERHAFDPGYPIALLDLRYPAVVMMVALTLGLLIYRRFRCPAHD